ncbi:response regulator transcription factor [Reyranella soli]|nr:response regulator transcription factor [Reyranella soli]
MSVLERLSPYRKFKVASLVPGDAEKWIRAEAVCSLIIYNVGGGSLADHKHLKTVRTLLRTSRGSPPLVVFSDNNARKEVLLALNAGARGFIYAGTEVHLAQQALAFILEGGSCFTAVQQYRERLPEPAAVSVLSDRQLPPVGAGQGAGETVTAAWAKLDLTTRQKAVLEQLTHGDSNKAIARKLGIREGTVKVHVRQIMRKLGVTNRTQVAIVCSGGTTLEGGSEGPKDRSEIQASGSQRGLGLTPLPS